MKTRQCSICGEYHPATAKHFYKAPTRKDGLSPKCKSCHSEFARVRRNGVHSRSNRIEADGDVVLYKHMPEDDWIYC